MRPPTPNPDNRDLPRAVDDVLMDVADNAMKAARYWRDRALEAERQLQSLQLSLDYIPQPCDVMPGPSRVSPLSPGRLGPCC